MASGIDFRRLQIRLLDRLKTRVRNGELTERSLARLSGVSQPHIHNVLKGTRLLSTEMADQILRQLRIDVSDLLAYSDVGAVEPKVEQRASSRRSVGFLDGLIGPGHPYPEKIKTEESFPFPAEELEGAVSPMLARLAPDPEMPDVLAADSIVLLDCSETLRQNPDKQGCYAVDLAGSSAIRRARHGNGVLWLLGENAAEAIQYQQVSLTDRTMLEVIRGRVRLVIRRP